MTSCVSNKKVIYFQNDKESAAKYAEFKRKDYFYTIQKEDVLYVGISSSSSVQSAFFDLSNTSAPTSTSSQHPHILGFTVNENGKVLLPVIGEVEAAGLTINDFQKKLTEIAQQYIPNPTIKVFLLNFYVKVLGEVKNPGLFQVLAKNPTVFDALGLAGDVKDFANKKRVKIIRTKPDKTEVRLIDLTKEDVIESDNYYIYPNDIVYVEPLNIKKFSTNNTVLPWIVSAITSIIVVINLVNINYIK